MSDAESIAIQIDTLVPAAFVFLRDTKRVKVVRSLRVAPGVIVNLDSRGDLVAVELIGPADLDFVMNEVAARFGAPELTQLETRRHVLEEVLSSPVH